MPVDILIVLAFVGFLAGFVDSIAGGGGLVSLPALFFVGLPPQLALGTNKLQGSFGTLVASINYIRNGAVEFRTTALAILFTFMGAAFGSWAVQQIDPGFIRHLIPFLLLFVFAYMIFSTTPGDEDRKARMPIWFFSLIFVPSLLS